MVYRVRSHRWHLGVLQTVEHLFAEELEAHAFSHTVSAHSVKVINHNNEIVSARSISFNQKPQAGYSGVITDYSGTYSTYA